MTGYKKSFILSHIYRLDELSDVSEPGKRVLKEKDEGILIDGQKKRKLTRKDKDNLKKHQKK